MADPIKFSAPDWCFFRENPDPAAYYRKLKQLGFTGVEMVDPSRWPAARSAGLSILNIPGPGMEKGLNRVENHAELVPKIRALIDQAAFEKIPHVIVFSGNRGGLDDRTGLSNCATALGPLAREADKARVTLIFEMFCQQNHPDYMADNSRFGFDLVQKVGSRSLKVLYDIYHMAQMGEDVIKDITGNLKSVAHIHVAEKPKRTAPLPAGEIPYGKIVRAVHEAGYSGYWGLEYHAAPDHFSEMGEALMALKSGASGPTASASGLPPKKQDQGG